MDMNEALELLRDPKGKYLDLAGKRVQRLKDRKAKRALEPVLQKVLPRRERGIEQSSYYRALRVKMLPHNPYFQRDVIRLRELFNIPKGQIADIDLSHLPKRGKPWALNGVLLAIQVAGYWLDIHTSVAKKEALTSGLPPLPPWLEKSASTMLEFGEHAPIPWLSKEPCVPAPYRRRFDLSLPIDHCIARLIERYGLPWLSVYEVCLFVLTGNSKYLANMLPFDVTAKVVRVPIGEALKITVDWVDEFTTRKLWVQIFDKYVKPKQESYWEERGDWPHSKQLEVEGMLGKPWVTELYERNLAAEEKSGTKIGIDRAIDSVPPCMAAAKGVDRSKAHHFVKTLDFLFEPLD
jgi:hypothetical protein